MEPKHKELLAQCRQSLAQAMTEVDKVVELLEAAGALGPRDLRDLEAAGGGKAELLIALLLAKERDHFQDLRVALEKTQPHLLSILYLNGVPGAPAAAEETAGSTYSVLSIMPSDSESSSSLSSIGTTGKASSPPPVTDTRQMSEKLETILFQLRQVTRERDELRKRLALSSPGSTFDDCRSTCSGRKEKKRN